MNVAELYQRLVATGILPAQKAEEDKKKEEGAKSIKPVDFKQRVTGVPAPLPGAKPSSIHSLLLTFLD
jgi:hypothetical protein